MISSLSRDWQQTAVRTRASPAPFHRRSGVAVHGLIKTPVTEPGIKRVLVDALRRAQRTRLSFVWLDVAVSSNHSTRGGNLNLFRMNYPLHTARSSGNWHNLDRKRLDLD